MTEGERINFYYNNEQKSGTVLKVYVQIGGENHQQQMVIIRLDGSSGLFGTNTLNLRSSELHLF
jgi:hypothetical protein